MDGRNPLQAESLAGGWLRVPVPLPYSLRFVNSYLIPEPDGGWTVIDPGLNTEEARDLWLDLLEEQGIGRGDVRRVLLTHQHPDHYGLSGWMQREQGCPVWMTEEAHRYAVRMWGRDSVFPRELEAWFRSHGMPEELLALIGPHLDSFRDRVEPQPEPSYLRTGESIRLGGRSWTLIDAPGHAPGAVCLYEPARRELIAGDQVLPRITPNISLLPGDGVDADPLRSYLRSLAELEKLPTERVYPGHREIFADAGARAREIADHHARRLGHLLGLLESLGEASAFELCELEFGAHLRRNIHNMRFALSETLAHLAYLERDGRAVARCGADGSIRYRGSIGAGGGH
ncbi:MBL fold metallo-hydrolase [Paenibacillus albicereus]|uniref:MBL fold metallo-hydrolase n=1 Tax=Paenibacillus albicereus TaxID=2726185 RepID=A0A6H2H057_9BACL|nr:MBL fold metallo-hydrolase [Paenibacillus albicereus]QJC52979.1 MBL fold metallo-hydrolase [Paenibacillus albicereus]